MSCERFEVEIEMRQHGALEPAEEAALDAHLATCDSCRRIAAESGATDAVLRDNARREIAAVDWSAIERGVTRLRRAYRRKLWLAPLFLLQVPLCVLLATGRMPDATMLAIGPASTVAIYVAWVWMVNRPFREVLAVVRSPDDLLRAYRRELRRQRLRSRIFAAVNGAITLTCAAAALFDGDPRSRIYAVGCAAVFGAWTAYDVLWKLPRLGRALLIAGNEDAKEERR
jgi:anti-sigma factor RsiW